MSDNTSLKDKEKPTVFYAQKSPEDKAKRSLGKRDSAYSKPSGRSSYGKSSSDSYQSDKGHSNHDRANDTRIETFKPRNKVVAIKENNSPWKNRFQATEQRLTFSEEIKPTIDQEQLKRQRKEETLIYGENSCQAVFANRPGSIVKAFILQEKTYEFKSLIAYLVEHRLGYDVIDNEKMTKITQTPHHGGVSLIIKKRQPITTGDYLLHRADSVKDYILAIDDIHNPHNLGGIARTAAFFNINGLLLRQPDLLEGGAALRVSEGGAEYITPIKADDFIASLDQFKINGYQLIVLLPYKVETITAEKLGKLVVKPKTVFVISQQINLKLAEFADKIIYLPGSKGMSVLNISVLTGVLLAQITN